MINIKHSPSFDGFHHPDSFESARLANFADMKVLFVVSEAFPLIKTGGLGDVGGALSAALAHEGADVRVLLPGYEEALDKLAGKETPIDLGDPLGAGPARLIPGRMPDSGVKTWLIDCPALFIRNGGPYTDDDDEPWPDNHIRFALLGRAAAMISIAGGFVGWQPDILHANDWQAGLAPTYLVQWSGRRTPSIFTIHNCQYQGLFDASIMPVVGLRQDMFGPYGLEFFGSVSYLKAGLVYSDRLTTVSPTYAKEIQTPMFGNGLEGVAASRSAVLHGILNGIDDETWNPATDRALAKTFKAGDLAGKAACKAAVQRELGLKVDAECPLIGIVSRFVPQKGLDLVVQMLPRLLKKNVQLAILGAGEQAIETAILDATNTHPGMVAAKIGYSEDLSHRIIAGADMFLVPSRFEPCGLTQMYAMRYGAVPIVRRTGGLADTVIEAENPGGTGFLFDAPTASALFGAVEAAIARFGDKEWWRTIQRRGMAQDFGWSRPARAYCDLYESLARPTVRTPVRP